MKEVMKVADEKESRGVDSESYNAFDFALGFGATYNFKHRFFASARYNVGLTNVLKGDDVPSNKNGVFQLSVGYNFLKR